MKKTSKALWGIALVAVGIVLALNALGITQIDIFFDGWWTLFIIVPCLIGIFTSYDKNGNIIGVCIGVFLLLCCRGVIDFSMLWKLLLPAIIVVIGLKMIFNGFFDKNGDQIIKKIKADNGSVKSTAATFSGANLDYTNEVFEGAQMDAVFGGIKCDLRNAQINSDCVINATAVFGGIDIFVPDSINVKVSSTSIFGGVSGKDLRNHPAAEHTLYLNATCLFGGVEIK